MKKKLILGIVAAASVVAISVTAFLGLFSASADSVLKTWSVASEFLSVIRDSGDDAANLQFKEFSYSPVAYTYTGFGPVKYTTTSYSYMATDQGQPWRAQIMIPNNQGVGTDKNIQGIYVYGSTTQTQKITFTAPVNGKYNFIPLALGGSQDIKESIMGGNGSMNVNILHKGAKLMDEMVVAKGEKKNLPKLEGLILNAGDTLEFTFAGTTFNDTSNQGNNVIVNFKIEIVNEYAPILTNETVENFKLANTYMVTNDIAALPATNGMFATGYVDANLIEVNTTDENTENDSFEVGKQDGRGVGLSLNAKEAKFVAALGSDPAYSWYYGLYGAADDSYGMFCYPNDDKITFKSKYLSSQGMIITADKDGRYTLECDSITKDGLGAMTLVVEKNKEVLYAHGDSDADGFFFDMQLKKGDKLYIYAVRTQTNWSTAAINLYGLNLKVVSPPKRVTPAVYDITEYNVSEELRNNTGSWETAYQDPADTSYTQSGFLKPVAYDIDNGTIADAWCRIYADQDEFSNANQSWLNNTMQAYADGSMRWVYDYGNVRMGFKLTVPENATYELYSDIFVGGGINVYIYEVSGSTFTQIGDAVAVPTTKDMSVSFEAKKGKTYAIVIGKSAAAWNDQKDCKTSSMVLKKKILVSDEIIEYLPITKTPDPNYVFKYKVEEMEMGLSSETASAGDEVTLTLDVNKTKFGFSGFVISVPYDSDKLELLSVEKGNIITKFGAEPLTDKNPLVLTFAQADNVTSTGSVAKLKFKVKDGASAGDITITPVVNNMVSSYATLVEEQTGVIDTTANVTVTSGTITVQ